VKPESPVLPSNRVMETGRPSPASLGEPASEALEERTLIARAKARDQEAFRVLVDRHRDRAYHLALRIVRTPADAEEVAQDAFVRAWHGLLRYRGDARFSTWLHRIVMRCALDRLAVVKTRASREVASEDIEIVENAGSGAGPSEPTTADARLEQLIGKLSPSQRAAVTLFYYEDRSVEDVARVMGVPENTVKTHLSRARAALRAGWLAEGEA
jgi:RNA polymerase sigma-70 factor (ECF subfamily)